LPNLFMYSCNHNKEMLFLRKSCTKKNRIFKSTILHFIVCDVKLGIFEVLVAVTTKIVVFSNVTLWSLVEVCWCFSDTCCHLSLMIEVEHIYQSTLCQISENNNFTVLDPSTLGRNIFKKKLIRNGFGLIWDTKGYRENYMVKNFMNLLLK